MRTQRDGRQIKVVFHRSFRRPVKIRVETEPPRSVDRIAPRIPAGILFLITQRLGLPTRPQLQVIRLELPPPDGRIAGDPGLKLDEESTASKV